MSENKGAIVVRANVEITTASLEAIVDNAKKLLRMDTADLVAELISRLLIERNFEWYAMNLDSYD